MTEQQTPKWWQRRRWPFLVTMHLNGRHPYLKSHHLDYPTRDIVFTVYARNWNDAAKVSLREIPEREWWAAHVIAISRQ